MLESANDIFQYAHEQTKSALNTFMYLHMVVE